MKYHYQFSSKTSVRIELISETAAEKNLLDELSAASPDHADLLELYAKGLQNYLAEAKLSSTRFMDFPRVALCRYIVADALTKKSNLVIKVTNSQLIFDF